ncbi:MAG: SpoIID/LytB domain-containing protein [Desulfuromonadaceae bacterium]|nr:SpoIID/LytB domain-containing protein [Desulfuromonadaceae bacterium]MDD5107689.1 SpoIID/LytB domain-containing protein [Desulfuromonadaceae bacterium]
MCSYLQVLRPLYCTLITFILALLSVFVVWPGSDGIGAAVTDETIRVAIHKSATEVVVAGDGLLVIGDAGKAVALSLPATVKPVKGGLLVGGRVFRTLSFSAASVVYVNSKPYRGIAELSVVNMGIQVVNQLPLEEYLVGLINCEISSAWPIEAVKAQAIIARTYAINRKISRATAPYHLESSVMDQVYEGCLIEDSRARRAVLETAGEVLTFGGAVIQAFYHSSCGGRTEPSENVWGMPTPYLKGVDCQYCLTSPSATNWECTLTLKELEEKLRAAGYKVSGLYGIKGGAAYVSGRLKQVVLQATHGGCAVSGEQFRKAIGYGVIKSTRFSTKISKDEVSFSGRGNGHGVGLCQWGAKQRALDGFDSGEILSYYYPGTTLKKFSEIR